MSNKIRFFALILALNIFFLCGCEGGNSSSKAVFSSEPDKVTSVASQDNAETSKEATPSSKNLPQQAQAVKSLPQQAQAVKSLLKILQIIKKLIFTAIHKAI